MDFPQLWSLTCLNYNASPGFVDPYLNTDAGTMSPFEHGEVFVLDDGGEVQSHFMLSSINDA